jgi:hypothetical protein
MKVDGGDGPCISISHRQSSQEWRCGYWGDRLARAAFYGDELGGGAKASGVLDYLKCVH